MFNLKSEGYIELVTGRVGEFLDILCGVCKIIFVCIILKVF